MSPSPMFKAENTLGLYSNFQTGSLLTPPQPTKRQGREGPPDTLFSPFPLPNLVRSQLTSSSGSISHLLLREEENSLMFSLIANDLYSKKAQNLQNIPKTIRTKRPRTKLRSRTKPSPRTKPRVDMVCDTCAYRNLFTNLSFIWFNEK